MTPSPIRIRSFAKVNLALSVLGRRPDGLHEVRTVLQTIDLCDELELESAGTLSLECPELESIPMQDNLVWKAAAALSQWGGKTRGARIRLHKRIPPGSGLAGGSSNAAATLLGLCRLWGLPLSSEDLIPLAAGLGSDVPFFLLGGTALAVGQGSEVYPLQELPTFHLLVIYPGVPISTADAYRSLSFMLTAERMTHKIERFCHRMAGGSSCLGQMFNDFEASILPAHRAIREAKEFLADRGAVAPLLSGSGSSVFGFFLDEESALAASRAPVWEGWRVFPAKTLSRAEYFQRMFG